LVLLERAPAPELTVLHRDAHLIAVDKPPHLPTTPHPEHVGSLLDLVRRMPGCEHAVPVHRLDAGTSGVCLFATRGEAVAELAAALSLGQKTYIALAQGVVHKRGVIRRSLLEGRTPRTAETRYTRTRIVGTHSLIDAQPKQGRKHQIRRHLQAVGHPLLGDAKYGKSAGVRHFFERHALDRPFLHCSRIILRLETGELTLEAPLAPDLQRVLAELGESARPSPALQAD
jgi:23S rRNA (uracil1939-C5)-methyltransferase